MPGTNPSRIRSDSIVVQLLSLKALREAESHCTRCPLYKCATQVVPGEGPPRARIMLVGEQPGDKEDLAGKPFVGPAGEVLARAMDEAGIDRETVFITNAVKHFKFEQRGKRRLHKKPNAYEIDRCHWWFDFERAIVKPEIIVALGATAVRSVTGKPGAINKLRGQVVRIRGGGWMIATVHPSFLLRIREREDRHAEYKKFVRDLRSCHAALKEKASASAG
jgi:uracil-DNA glycosylase